MSNLEMFTDMLSTHIDSDVSDEVINSIIDKIKNVLNDDEKEIIDALGRKLLYAKVQEDFVDRYEEVDSSHLNDIFKRYIWDNSDDWADEMFSVSDGIMSNLNTLESEAIKQFIIELNKKDNINA